MPPQLDDYASARTLRAIGFCKEFAARARFYFGYPQFLMIAVLFYYQSALIRDAFPTIWAWVAFLAVGGIAAMAFEYVVVYPSQVVFNRGQGEREQRSPMFQEVMANSRKIDRLLDHQASADGGRAVAVPECTDCDRRAVPGTHKGRAVWRCPGCDDILWRDIQ